MKKIFSIFVFSIFLGILVAPLASLAQSEPPSSCEVQIAVPKLNNCKDIGKNISEGTEGFGLCCFVQMIHKITNWVFYIMTIIAILLFVYGGMTYMTALGDPEKAKKGRSIIIYAMIGLLIALLAKIVPNIVISIVK